MPFMRFLFFLLLLLNFLALASLSGWLGHSSPPGEPQRLTNQLHPERLQLLDRKVTSSLTDAADEGAAPMSPDVGESEPGAAEIAEPVAGESSPSETGEVEPALAAVENCLRYSGLSPDVARTLLNQARKFAPNLQLDEISTEVPRDWWVSIPPAADQTAAELRVTALRALGIQDYFIVRDAGPQQFAISLGVFKTDAAATRHLQALRAMGVTDVRLTQRGLAQHQVELRGPADLLSATERSLRGLVPQARGEPCQ